MIEETTSGRLPPLVSEGSVAIMRDDEIDFDRVLHDHKYRREVVERLNREAARAAKQDGEANPPAGRQTGTAQE